MGHELRTPLNAIVGLTQLIQLRSAPGDEPSLERWIAQIAKAGWHMVDVLDMLMELGRAGTVHASLKSQPSTWWQWCATRCTSSSARRRHVRQHRVRRICGRSCDWRPPRHSPGAGEPAEQCDQVQLRRRLGSPEPERRRVHADRYPGHRPGLSNEQMAACTTPSSAWAPKAQACKGTASAS
jgi:signal transduction histidine kinase